MILNVRRAGGLDASGMALVVNEIIHKGGTTALKDQISRNDILVWMQQSPDQSAWHIAETDQARILGFQTVQPATDLPADACNISTFVETGRNEISVGSRLFDRTAEAARVLGYRWINASVRADNPGALTYYQSRGFETYGRTERLVSARVRMRFDLT
ncbi:MAG: GNAT family N-acetyltransferase [Pseudomonadota bacterium]